MATPREAGLYWLQGITGIIVATISETDWLKPGLGIRSLVFQANRSFFWSKIVFRSCKRVNHSRLLFCKVRRERFAHGMSFVKSNKSELLLSLFTNEQKRDMHDSTKGDNLIFRSFVKSNKSD